MHDHEMLVVMALGDNKFAKTNPIRLREGHENILVPHILSQSTSSKVFLLTLNC